ncbi:hypothetical protein CURE108131_25240 [Cupriavidus respiraculi]|uniref:Xaa-Pro dipeptidyl-peptidase C-terminal domain-containing protein n=1 Tax=Cupriavidus respiraculi TaxID=195930 RepID=A0ABM8XVE5_9BURK|nr:hypothetical protein [Cupriavidus respiraculi]CAG9184365.1 hypothetical protein LMG21510_05079 [Cupriavidus respiraculi]
MPATYPTASIFLEAHFFGEDREELRLPCEAVTVGQQTIVVRGVEARQLTRLRWTPDALSFDVYDHHIRHRVGRPEAVDPLTVRFPLR